MAKVKVVVRKKRKQKIKPEKKNMLVPRLRLEPRLNSSLNFQNSNNNEQARSESNEQIINTSNKHPKNKLSSNDIKTEEGNSDINNTEITEGDKCPKAVNHKTASTLPTFNTDVIEFPLQFPRKTAKITFGRDTLAARRELQINNRTRRTFVPRSRTWSDRELMDFTTAFQIYGMGELGKIAEFIKTKNETAVREYIRSSSTEYRRAKKMGMKGRPQNSWFHPSLSDLGSWPNVRKWRKMAFNQMLPLSRQKDLSQPIISSLCKRFYEEAEEISDPQVIDVKSIYKYLMDCVAGNIPAQLPPKESALVLELLKETKFTRLQYNFDEEEKFLREYKTATRFKPFRIKDEFKRRFENDTSEIDERNVVPVPEEVFMELSRHKKIVQGLNPLVTPVWMLQKEQGYLKNYIKKLQM